MKKTTICKVRVILMSLVKVPSIIEQTMLELCKRHTICTSNNPKDNVAMFISVALYD